MGSVDHHNPKVWLTASKGPPGTQPGLAEVGIRGRFVRDHGGKELAALKEAAVCGGRCARKEDAAAPAWKRKSLNGVIESDFVPRRNRGRRVCAGAKKPERVVLCAPPRFMVHILGAIKVAGGGPAHPGTTERLCLDAAEHSRSLLRITEKSPASCLENSPRWLVDEAHLQSRWFQ